MGLAGRLPAGRSRTWTTPRPWPTAFVPDPSQPTTSVVVSTNSRGPYATTGSCFAPLASSGRAGQLATRDRRNPVAAGQKCAVGSRTRACASTSSPLTRRKYGQRRHQRGPPSSAVALRDPAALLAEWGRGRGGCETKPCQTERCRSHPLSHEFQSMRDNVHDRCGRTLWRCSERTSWSSLCRQSQP